MPRFIGPGCITIAWSGSRASAAVVEPVAAAVLAGAREERGVHPLLLHPQHHHRVGLLERGVEVVRRLDRPRLDPDRQERRRGDQRDLGAQRVEQQHVGARHPAVQDVADDRDPSALEVAEVAAHGERVEQSLRRVLVRAVAGVDDRAVGPAAWRAGAAHRSEPWRMTTASAPIACRVRAVSLRLSPLDTLEPLAEKLMTSALSRLAAASNEMRVRVESSKNRLTTVRPRSVGSFLIGRSATPSSSSAVSRMRQRVVAGQVGGDEQVCLKSCRSSRWMTTASRRLLRERDLDTFSTSEVGRFLPTKSARIGSSRWPRSTSTASCTAWGGPRSLSASSAARIVRPENSTSSTRTTTCRRCRRGSRCARGPGPGLQPQVVAVHRDVECAGGDDAGPRPRSYARDAAGERDATRRDAQQRRCRRRPCCARGSRA